MQNREKLVRVNKNCGRQLCNLLKNFSLFCTNSGKKFFESLCNLPIDKSCRVWYNGISDLLRSEKVRQDVQKFSTFLKIFVQFAQCARCTKIFNIFKNFCTICTLCKLYNGILTNHTPHFLYKVPKSRGKVNKPRLHLCLFCLLTFGFCAVSIKGIKLFKSF